jgi:hypothetical protein
MAPNDEPKALVALLALAVVLYVSVGLLTEPATEPAASGIDLPLVLSGLAPPPLADRGWLGHMAGPHHGWADGMRCVACGSEAVTERPERTAQGYRRFRCRACGKQSNERSGTVLNRAQYPSDVVALVVLWATALQAEPA